MESYNITCLPPLLHSAPSHLSEKLPEFRPLFFVPPLEDRPQNPIVDTLVDVPLPKLKRREEIITRVRQDEELRLDQVQVQERKEDLWAEPQVVAKTRAPKNQNLSWDALRTTFLKEPSSTPFLSEQSNDVFDAVRHHVRPRLNDPSLELRYILPTELLDHLLINMVGNSSPLYIWDPKDERLVPCGTQGDTRLLVIIEGLDDVASTKIIQRFLNIGTYMRRLESLVVIMRQGNSNPTTHAFAHALSSVLFHIRTSLARQPPYPATHITSLWLHYADIETILNALASLCNRSQCPPHDPLPKSTTGLLSYVYECLEQQIERGASRVIIAILAYILTTTSMDYFASLGESLGLFEPSRAFWLRTGPLSKSRPRRPTNDMLSLNDVELDQSSISSGGDDLDQRDMPSFIPIELGEALPAARKSLRILQTADPDHPLCATSVEKSCGWVWSPEEVEKLWGYREQQDHSGPVKDDVREHHTPPDTPDASARKYRPGLEEFRIFDLEPGGHMAKVITSLHLPLAVSLPAFLASFPDRLPPLTPKLQHLTAVVLQPLFTRTSVLSSSLLKLYLTSLQLETHLILLRSYMLVTLSSFRTRLVEALFSDSDEHRPMGRGIRARTLARLGIHDDVTGEEAIQDAGHGIGLGYGLAARDTWPPGGADLSFFLRRVIVDSLEERAVTDGAESTESVWKEGEVRLGFALRDLPVGDGRERWLNPMSIEALDFLYLDYKPPQPLDVVITPDILSKYQRTFTFLLRLFRAQTVTRIAYRSTFKSAGPVFSYAPKAQEMLAFLRFQIHAFVTAFVTYVFDSVIGGNFDVYLRRVTELRSTAAANNWVQDPDHEITDVFALRDSHSQLLDHILNGCLLRTAQRAAGDALRDLLELVLRFGVLVTSLRRGAIQETEGIEEISELYELFQTQMLKFVKITQAMHTKDQTNAKHAFPIFAGHTSAGSAGQCSHLEDLMTRIDPTRWWRQKLEKQTTHAL